MLTVLLCLECRWRFGPYRPLLPGPPVGYSRSIALPLHRLSLVPRQNRSLVLLQQEVVCGPRQSYRTWSEHGAAMEIMNGLAHITS